MPGLTGFEVAWRLVEAEVRSHLVFVTAFDQYASRCVLGKRRPAIDYLLKPVDAGNASSRPSPDAARRAGL